mmetsp:Transcript_19356/g.41584  ORF Transcript_19356/g.41584 Transcript_19356/m.41584 type:complete len:240 (+) Transcript_19356:896-1615(+)
MFVLLPLFKAFACLCAPLHLAFLCPPSLRLWIEDCLSLSRLSLSLSLFIPSAQVRHCSSSILSLSPSISLWFALIIPLLASEIPLNQPPSRPFPPPSPLHVLTLLSHTAEVTLHQRNNQSSVPLLLNSSQPATYFHSPSLFWACLAFVVAIPRLLPLSDSQLCSHQAPTRHVILSPCHLAPLDPQTGSPRTRDNSEDFTAFTHQPPHLHAPEEDDEVNTPEPGSGTILSPHTLRGSVIL